LDSDNFSRSRGALKGFCVMAVSSSMNLFRITGDLVHCVSIFILIHKMRKTRSCTGNCTDRVFTLKCFRNFKEDSGALCSRFRNEIP